MARLHYISSYVIHTSLCPLCSFYLITRLYSGNTQRNTDVKCLMLNHLIAMKPIIIEYKLIHNFIPISDGIACFRWIDKEPNLATFHVKGISPCILCLSIDFICRREQYCNHWKLRGKKSAIVINLCVLCSLDCDKRDNKNRDSRENYRLYLEKCEYYNYILSLFLSLGDQNIILKNFLDTLRATSSTNGKARVFLLIYN